MPDASETRVHVIDRPDGYALVLKWDPDANGWAASSPDVPGFAVFVTSPNELEKVIRTALPRVAERNLSPEKQANKVVLTDQRGPKMDIDDDWELTFQ